MADRSSHYGIDNVLFGLANTLDTEDELSAFGTDTGIAPEDSAYEDSVVGAVVGDSPLVRLTKRPTLTPVPRPHNAAALASSVFANANLPVMNVHAKTRKLEVRGR